MELVNDLVVIIATYATERVTYSLLTLHINTANLAYQPSVWHYKTLVERRGLVVNDSVVGGKWANYYRVSNRNYYGGLQIAYPDDVTRGIDQGISIPTVPKDGTFVVVTTCISTDKDHPRIIGQRHDNTMWSLYADESVYIYDLNIYRLVRIVSVIDSRYFYALSERGTLYFIKIDHTEAFVRVVSELQADQVVYINDNSRRTTGFISRSGIYRIIYDDRAEIRTDLNGQLAVISTTLLKVVDTDVGRILSVDGTNGSVSIYHVPSTMSPGQISIPRIYFDKYDGIFISAIGIDRDLQSERYGSYIQFDDGFFVNGSRTEQYLIVVDPLRFPKIFAHKFPNQYVELTFALGEVQYVSSYFYVAFIVDA